MPSLAADIKQAGAMVVTFKDDISTLDPAIGYDWKNWAMIKSLFDGMLDYKPGTTEIVPDLAESYDIAPDGLTYTFHLRHGVKFHNGREMKAADVKYSLERTCNPKTQSPGSSFFGAIEGFELSGGVFGHKSILPAPPSIELGKDVAFVAPEVEETIEKL